MFEDTLHDTLLCEESKVMNKVETILYVVCESKIVYTVFTPTCIKYSEKTVEELETLPSPIPVLEGRWTLGDRSRGELFTLYCFAP